MVTFQRFWSMPSADTFTVPPIGQFVQRHMAGSKVSVDPFARNNQWATYRNDINPATNQPYHLDAVAFLEMLAAIEVRCDLAVIDPPYSPRQISECYRESGLSATMADTQNSRLYASVREALLPVLTDDAVVLSFGWNSVGMGKKHGFEQIEIALVCHGGAHNDTICLAEKRVKPRQLTLA